jgi:hypothetical protein
VARVFSFFPNGKLLAVSKTATAATSWSAALASWAIPEEILRQAPDDPWHLPVALFEYEPLELTPSHRIARHALQPGDTILDVGAGRCAMSLPLRPPAARIVAVDGSAEMLEASPADATVLGRWPQVADEAGRAEIVICGHVLYNVSDLEPFVVALDHAARRRVVVEITNSHPRNRPLERELWKHFWGIDRPTEPGWKDAVAVIEHAGIRPEVEHWESDQRGGFKDLDDLVQWSRQTVCLDRSRAPEVRSIVLEHAVERDGRWRMTSEPRSLTTIWWDVKRA